MDLIFILHISIFNISLNKGKITEKCNVVPLELELYSKIHVRSHFGPLRRRPSFPACAGAPPLRTECDVCG